MKNADKPHKIKPVIHKNVWIRLMTFVLIEVVIVLGGWISNGSSDIGLLVILIASMSIFTYGVFRLDYKTIDINHETCIYRHSFKKTKIDLKCIKKIKLMRYTAPNRQIPLDRYCLMISGSCNLNIVNLHVYRRKDMEMLIEKMYSESQHLSRGSYDTKINLNEVNWID